jgi:hypothetical protein
MKQIDWITEFTQGVQNLGEQFISFLPVMLIAFAVLLVGWLVARLLRMLSIRFIRGLDIIWQKFVLRTGLDHLQARQPPAKIVGELVFWLTIMFFVTLAAQILGLNLFVTWVEGIVVFLPVLAAGLLIVLVGFILSSLARDLIASTASTAGLAQADLLGRATQIVILFTAIVLGIAQVGIEIGFLSIVIGILLATGLGSVGLAFGLGAKAHVGNVIAAHQVRQIYQVGDTVRIADIEGRIIEITPTLIIMEGQYGRQSVPARFFIEQISVLKSRETDNEA